MPDPKQRVLIVDDDPAILAGLTGLLEDSWEVRAAATGREAIVAFSEFAPDVVLLDVQLPGTTGVELLQQFKMYSESVPVIMMSGAGTLSVVVDCVKLGAETFLQKPFDYDALSLALGSASRTIATNRELAALRRSDHGAVDRLPGVSTAIGQLDALIERVAPATSPILIVGESGTGKGMIARLIHKRSPRARGPFVDLNCAGLSKELLESELFGHERGSFTGATQTKQGLFEIAAGGTLFLDEIGEMDILVQARLLKAVEDRRFRRVGGVRDLNADFRLITATNRDLAGEVRDNRFRGDLYYRLNVVSMAMPPLRERLEDLPVLVEALLLTLAKEMGRRAPSVSRSAMGRLAAYPWPGNVRELRNVLERALLTITGNEIRSDDLLLDANAGDLPTPTGALPSNEWEIRPLDDIIARYVAAAVDAAGGNVRKAARQLQISPSTLYARLRKESPER